MQIDDRSTGLKKDLFRLRGRRKSNFVFFLDLEEISRKSVVFYGGD